MGSSVHVVNHFVSTEPKISTIMRNGHRAYFMAHRAQKSNFAITRNHDNGKNEPPPNEPPK